MKADLSAGATFHNQIAQERPHCAAMIGAVAMTWSSLEQTLALCFSIFSNPGMGSWSGAEHSISLEAFDAIESLRQKRELLLIAARKRLGEELLADLERILKHLDKVSKQRNKVIHGRWLVSDKYPDALIYTQRMGGVKDAKVYDIRKFAEIIDNINRVHADLDNFLREKAQSTLKSVTGQHVDFMRTFIASNDAEQP